MRITAKGQVTIPKEIREKAGLLPHTDVDFVLERGGVRILKSGRARPRRGERVVERLRSSAGRVTMSTAQITRLTHGE